MKMTEIISIVQSEKSSEEFLRERNILIDFNRCYKCNSLKIGMIRADRWKCYNCKSEWSRRKDSILSSVRLKYSDFILCLKFFQLELTATQTSLELGLNYKTVKYLFNCFSQILTNFNETDIEGEFLLAGRAELIRIYLDKNKKIKLSTKDENLKLLAVINLIRKRVPNGGVYYSINFNEVNNKKAHTIDENLFKFIRYVKKILNNYRGTARRNLIQKLKELEYRFNHPEVDIFDEIIVRIAEKTRVVRYDPAS